MQFIICLAILATVQFVAAETVKHVYSEGRHNKVIVTGDDSYLKHFGASGYSCGSGVVTVIDEAKNVDTANPILLLVPECEKVLVHVYKVEVVNNQQKLHYNYDYNSFAETHTDPVEVTFAVSMGNNPLFNLVADQAAAESNNSPQLFQANVEKHISRVRRTGGKLSEIIKDVAEDVLQAFSKNGSTQENSLEITKKFNLDVELLDATQKCWGITANEKVSVMVDGEVDVEIGYHFVIKIADWKLEILDHYVYITHNTHVDATINLDIYMHYANAMQFKIAQFDFSTFNVTGIATITPSVAVRATVEGELNAAIIGNISTGFYYNNDTTYFDNIGDIIHNPKALLGTPIIKKPVLNVTGEIDADVNVFITVDINALVKMQIALNNKDPFQLVDGNVGIKAKAGAHLVGSADVAVDATFNNSIIPKVDEFKFAGSLTVSAFADVGAYFSGLLLGKNNTFQFDLWHFNKTLITLGSPKAEATSAQLTLQGFSNTQSALNDVNKELASLNNLVDSLSKEVSSKSRRSVRDRRFLDGLLDIFPIKLTFECKKKPSSGGNSTGNSTTPNTPNTPNTPANGAANSGGMPGTAA
eukprot:Pgem_evm1s18658